VTERADGATVGGARQPDRAPVRPMGARAVALRTLHAVGAFVDGCAAIACGVLLAGLVVLVVVSVVFRYGLNSSLSWSEELARYMSCWLVFLGVSVAYRRGEHVAVTSLLYRLPGRWGRVAVGAVEALTLLIVLLLALLGWFVTADNFERNQTTPALGIEIAWVYLAIPAGFAITALHSLARLLDPHACRPAPGSAQGQG
jgi:TRAP-type C4-dicarboxylate transport system permease small subunit